MSKSTLKNRFFIRRLKMKQNTAKIEAELQMYFDSGWGELFSEKTSVQVSAVPKLIVSL